MHSQTNLTQIWKHDYIYTFHSFFLFRHKVQKFCCQSGTYQTNQIKCDQMLLRRIYSVKVFEKFPWWLLLLIQSMAPISSLTRRLKKVWEKASMIIVSKIYFAFLLVALPMILRSIFGWSSRNMFNKNSSSILKSISMR